MTLDSLATPALLLDVDRVRWNAETMRAKARRLGVRLRPHIKTHKCIEVARLQLDGLPHAVTVSTLAEARVFIQHGFTDVTYAVPIDPGKFDRVASLATSCERFAVITGDADIPSGLDAAAARVGVTLDVFLDVDCGYHRTGVDPLGADAIAVTRRIAAGSHLRFAGILTHAGHAYRSTSLAERVAIAREERDVMVTCADRLRAEGVPVPAVSIGSTPTMTAIDDLSGIDEIRPGNYVFFDAMQAQIGSCRIEDCALTVLAAVVHRDVARQRIAIDAGALALSKDPGVTRLDAPMGYGRVLDLEGRDLGVHVSSVAQEHGLFTVLDDRTFDRLRIGSRVRILVNHSCLTAAQHTHYEVVEGDRVIARWPIHRGWHA
jgi:D-serine deaminase-like pyridoxal phosphate-dependent protein